jgi:hypothetical protein
MSEQSVQSEQSAATVTPRSQKRLVLIAIGAACLIALLIIAAWLLMSRATPDASLQTAQAPAPAPSATAHVGHKHGGKHSHAVSAALMLDGPQYLDPATRWFDPPSFTKANLFTASSTPLSVDASCAKRAEMQFPTLEAAVRKAAGVDTTQPIPLDAIAQQVSQFWQVDGWFYQVSAGWEKSIPPTYTLEYYRSPQADFQSGVERLNLANSVDLDALALAERIDELVAEAESRGGKRGARMVQLLLGGGTDGNHSADSQQDLKIHNGRPIAWMFGYGHCRLRTDGQAFCKCINPATSSSTQKGEYKVID